MIYRIVEWDDRYEVGNDNRPFTPGKTKRKGNLRWVRLTVFGEKWGKGWRKLRARVGKRRMAQVFGIFAKALEFAAQGEADERGFIPDPVKFAADSGLPLDQVELAYAAMIDLGWIASDENQQKKVKTSSQPTETGIFGAAAKAKRAPAFKNPLDMHKTSRSDALPSTCSTDPLETVTSKSPSLGQEGGFPTKNRAPSAGSCGFQQKRAPTRPYQTRVTKRKKESASALSSAIEILFDQFWSAYPKKMAKDAAYRAFAKRKPSEALLATMLAAIERQKHSRQWLEDHGRYIPHPATWLNQARWEDAEDAQPESPEESLERLKRKGML